MAAQHFPDLEAKRALSEELRQQLERLMAEAPKLVQRGQALQVTVRSRDGMIAATVGPRGDLIELRLDPRIYHNHDSEALAQAITKTVQQAGRKARKELTALFAPFAPREQVEASLAGDVKTIEEQMHKQMRGERLN